MRCDRALSNLAFALLLLLASTGLAACAGEDPATRLERRRALYSAELTGFVVQDEPGKEGSGILLDVLLRREGGDPLPGITLDVSMADAKGAEKAHRRVWVEARDAGPGGSQITLTLTDLTYEPGDGFWVEVRTPVPAAERGEYREFATGGAG